MPTPQCPTGFAMNSLAPDHLFAAKHLISAFFRDSERKLSPLTQKFSSNSTKCGHFDVAEVIFFSFHIG